jgi:hypothetical protein
MSDLDAPITVEETAEPVEVSEASEVSTTDLRSEPMPDIASNYMPLVKFYGIDNLDQTQQGKLQTIWEHFAQDAKTPSTVLKKITTEHYSMVQPNIGETRLQQMYNYVRILQDIQESNQIKQAYRK